MATKTQVEEVFEKIQGACPADFFDLINDTKSGMAAVLHLLSESGGMATAGKISAELNVSTARVAVLLKKMAAKDLITKEKGALDGRITVVKLTELGEETVSRLKEEIFRQIGSVIDGIGEERLCEFLAVLGEIKTIIHQTDHSGIELK